MPPLTRQQTFGSVHSWWSDSNPNLRGPTINLHVVAKPLIKLLHNRQALEIIRNNRGIPLSPMKLELYWSYLLYVDPPRHPILGSNSLSRYKYVSVSTKSAIVDDLSRRLQSESEALVVDLNMLHDLLQLEPPVEGGENMQVPTLSMLVTLVKWEATAEATCGSLVALLR
jgi:hypothetical protein